MESVTWLCIFPSSLIRLTNDKTWLQLGFDDEFPLGYNKDPWVCLALQNSNHDNNSIYKMIILLSPRGHEGKGKWICEWTRRMKKYNALRIEKAHIYKHFVFIKTHMYSIIFIPWKVTPFHLMSYIKSHFLLLNCCL